MINGIVNIIFAIICFILGLSMIIAPKKITERPASKIKSEIGVRICGVVLILIAVACLLI